MEDLTEKTMKYCPQCGQFLEEKLVDERKRFVCQSCGYIEYRNPLPVVVGVLTKPKKRQVLLIKRGIEPGKGEWALPGGFVEEDETPKEAVLREIKEELGVEASIEGLVGVEADDSSTYGKVVLIGYHLHSQFINYSPSEEVIEAEFFTESKTPLLVFPSHIAILKHFYQFYRNPIPTVDAIVLMEEGVVLIKRKNPPYGWALPGGFVNYNETLEQAVIREVKEETNLKIKNLRQFHSYSHPGRDPRDHTISTVFIGEGEGNPQAGDDAKKMMIYPRERIPTNLSFDHSKILQDYFTSRK